MLITKENGRITRLTVNALPYDDGSGHVFELEYRAASGTDERDRVWINNDLLVDLAEIDALIDALTMIKSLIGDHNALSKDTLCSE